MIPASAQENRAPPPLPALPGAPGPPRRWRWRKHARGDLTFQHGGGGRLGPRVEAATAAGRPCRKRLPPPPPPPPLPSLLGQGARARWGEWGSGPIELGPHPAPQAVFTGQEGVQRLCRTTASPVVPTTREWVSVSAWLWVSERVCVCVPALLCPRVLKAWEVHFFVTGPVQRGPTADACWAGLPERAARGGGTRPLPYTARLPPQRPSRGKPVSIF